MSRDQIMSMLRKQVAVEGGCGDMPCMGGNGGLFTAKSKAGLHAYQAFRAAHPGLSRQELSAAWHRHKMGGMMSAGALVGGFPGQKAAFADLKRAIKAQNLRAKDEAKALREERKALRDAYEAAHPGYRAKPRSARAIEYSHMSSAAKKAYKDARNASRASGICPPFVGSTSANALNRIADQLKAMALEHKAAEVGAVAEMAPYVREPRIPGSEALEALYPEADPFAAEMAELGLGLGYGRRRRY